jgi:tetratricopeptide (TPR) repeat protein
MPDLRILFGSASDGGYRAHLADSEDNRLGVEVPFTPFLDDDDYEDLRWYLEEYMDLPDGGAIVRAQRIERNLDLWGRRLHDDLFAAPENRALLTQLLMGPEPRELTLATRNPDLLRLPWELMADGKGSLAQRLSVRRQLEMPEEATPRPAQLPLRLLYIVSRPADAGFIDPRLTSKALLDALDPLGAHVRVDFCRPPTLARMEEMLRDGQRAGDPYGLVHFDGHGTFLPEEQTGFLCFEKPEKSHGATTDFVTASRFGDLLSRYAIPVVILEACRSATVGKTSVFDSVAPRLIQAGVGSVLAMSHAVHVEATRLLLGGFYRELVRGATTGQAVAEARKVLWSTPARWIELGPSGRTVDLRDWFLPQLYQSAGDEALVPTNTTNAGEGTDLRSFRSPASGEESGSFPPSPQYAFRGRAYELHDLERQFRIYRGIVLHAMGGMGKTALATEAAHWWTRSGLFRDGSCFLSFEQFTSADRVVQILGTYLAGPKFDQLPTVEQRRHAIELFQQKDVLMVWDNFESALPQFNNGAAVHGSPYTDDERRLLAELFRDLTTGPGKGCLLVTCRPGDTGLPDARGYELQGLARADSLWLLSRILKRDGLDLSDLRLSRDRLDPLLRDLADHPLSLESVGPYLRTLTPEAIRADFGKLLTKFEQDAPEARNKSLLASLEFSRRHLSAAALEALPWLGLFSVGVFEQKLLELSQMSPEAWEHIRRELQDTALLRVEGALTIGDRPFLRFHPTLASAVADATLAQNLEIRQRFVDVYSSLMRTLDEALKGPQSRIALKVLDREEANYRTAVRWAVADQQLRIAAELGHTFRDFLERSGRLRERDAWVHWLKDAVSQEGFTAESAAYEREHAWTRFTQGDPQGAIDQLQKLVDRLRCTKEFDSAPQLVTAMGELGKILDACGLSEQAISTLRETVALSEARAEKSGGGPWEAYLDLPDPAKSLPELKNLSTAMGILANALRNAGQHAEALSIVGKALIIDEALDDHHAIAACHGQCANIFLSEGRYDEADARYGLALAAARRVGDKELEGSLLQHQGSLADNRNQRERATRLYRSALDLFWQAGAQGEIMRTYNLLGVAEARENRFAEARAWFKKSHELAFQLQNQKGISQAAQNTGIVYKDEGDMARKQGDESSARRLYKEALRFGEEDLQVKQLYSNKPDEAFARSLLAQIYLRLGDFDTAERHAHESRKIREPLSLKEVVRDYDSLSEIAQARGDLSSAAEWAKKRDDLLKEIEGRAGEHVGLSKNLLRALKVLTIACVEAGFGNGDLGTDEKPWAQFDQFPAPLPEFAVALRQIAAGNLPPIPQSWPRELRELLEDEVAKIRVASQ